MRRTTAAYQGGIAVVSLVAGVGAPAATQALQSGAAPPTREQVQQAAAAPAEESSRLTVDGGLARAPCPLADPRYAAMSIRLAGVAFDGLAGLPADALRPAYADQVGRAVPLAALCTIRDAATAILTRAGYVAAVAVPAQDAPGGVVRMRVIMARLVRVTIGGRPGRAAALLARYGDRLMRRPLLNVREAERTLLLARDVPGYDIRLVLWPADGTPGNVAGELVATRRRIVVSATVQNLGSTSVGRWGSLLSGEVNDLFGHGDRLSLGLFNTVQPHEQTVAQGGYERRIGSDGLTLGGRVTYAWTRPDLGEEEHPLTSRTLVGSLEAAYPIRRGQRLDLRVTAGGDLIDQDLRLFGIALTRDRLRVLYARLDLGASDPGAIPGWDGVAPQRSRWSLAGTIEARRGLGILGAHQRCGLSSDAALCQGQPSTSRLDGDATAMVLRFAGEAEWRPARWLGVALGPRLQYGLDPLLSYEQYSGGAYTIGRGYDPGAIAGDSGAGTSAELRLSGLGRGDVSLRPFAFVDAAWVWDRDTGTGASHDRLLSAGGGVRAAWGMRARLDLTLARPLHRTGSETSLGPTRVLVSLTTRLAPWRGD